MNIATEALAAWAYELGTNGRTLWENAERRTRERYLAAATELVGHRRRTPAHPPAIPTPATVPIADMPTGTHGMLPFVVNRKPNDPKDRVYLRFEGVGGTIGWETPGNARGITLQAQPTLTD